MFEIGDVPQRLAKIPQFLPAQAPCFFLVGKFSDAHRRVGLDQASALGVRKYAVKRRDAPGCHPFASGGRPAATIASGFRRLSRGDVVLHSFNVWKC